MSHLQTIPEGYVREIDGVHELVATADHRVSEGIDEMGNSSITGDYAFTDTHSLEEAVALARDGWPDGVDQITDIAKRLRIDEVIGTSALQLITTFDVEGDEPDIDRYLQGDPENMVQISTTIEPYGNVIDIVVNTGQHANIDKNRIRNRGASVLAVIEALRASGYSVGILAVEQTRARDYDSSLMRYEIPILAPGQPVNVDTLAFAVMHPSFLRRLIFATNEAEEPRIRRNFGYRAHGGYGMPIDLSNYTPRGRAVIIDKDDGLSYDLDDAEAFAKSLIKDILGSTSTS